jgi:hypothetical protein
MAAEVGCDDLVSGGNEIPGDAPPPRRSRRDAVEEERSLWARSPPDRREFDRIRHG